MSSFLPQIGFSRPRAGTKNWFFDRPHVMRRMNARTHKFLRHSGGYARRVARNSIKTVRVRFRDMTPEQRAEHKRRRAIARFYGRPLPPRPRDTHPSRPGEPPRSITGLLRDNIFYAFEPTRRSVVIGPVKLNGGSGAPAVLEHGGTARIGGRKVRIAPRPYMGPALEKTTEPSKIRSFWAKATA